MATPAEGSGAASSRIRLQRRLRGWLEGWYAWRSRRAIGAGCGRLGPKSGGAAMLIGTSPVPRRRAARSSRHATSPRSARRLRPVDNGTIYRADHSVALTCCAQRLSADHGALSRRRPDRLRIAPSSSPSSFASSRRAMLREGGDHRGAEHVSVFSFWVAMRRGPERPRQCRVTAAFAGVGLAAPTRWGLSGTACERRRFDVRTDETLRRGCRHVRDWARRLGTPVGPISVDPGRNYGPPILATNKRWSNAPVADRLAAAVVGR